MDLGSVDVDEKASPHSADDRHQHYAVSKVVDDRPAPRRVEVLLGKERRAVGALMRRRRSRRPALCLEQISLPLRANMA